MWAVLCFYVNKQYDLLTDYFSEKVNTLKADGAGIISLIAGAIHISTLIDLYKKMVYNQIILKILDVKNEYSKSRIIRCSCDG